MNKQAIIESLKEVIRIVVLAAITAAVGWATNKLSGLDPNSLFYVVGTLVLRFVDKWLHENQNVSAKGLLPF